jgi:hypothetical protein
MVHDNVPAHLGLFHFLDFLVELKSLLSVDKLFLLGRPGGLASEIAKFIGSVRAAVMVMMVIMAVVVMMVMVVVVIMVAVS